MQLGVSCEVGARAHQWNQRMRKTRSASPCVTSTRLVLTEKRPALMSRISCGGATCAPQHNVAPERILTTRTPPRTRPQRFARASGLPHVVRVHGDAVIHVSGRLAVGEPARSTARAQREGAQPS